MLVTVTYSPGEDHVEAVVDGRRSQDDAVIPWDDSLCFFFAGDRLTGFEIAGFKYFVDYLPFYRLFGPAFVERLSDLQSRVTTARHSERSDLEVGEQSTAGRRFERSLAGV